MKSFSTSFLCARSPDLGCILSNTFNKINNNKEDHHYITWVINKYVCKFEKKNNFYI